MKSKSPNHPFAGQYAIYNRKSTDDAENQKNSLAYQRMRNLESVKKNGLPVAEGLTVAGFCEKGIIDESHSGFKENEDFTIGENGSIQYNVLRPKFLRLVQMLKNKEINGVVFLCWDRASRNKQDDLIIKKLMTLGCDIRFAETTYEKGSSGDLHMDVDGMFSAHYSRVISEKVKNASLKLRAEGRCLYLSPIGYFDKGSDNKPMDPERAPIVKRVFELYATGDWSFPQLAIWANGQGLTTKPSRRKRTKEERGNNMELDEIPKLSRPVDHKVIENILHNPFYIGKLKTKGGGYVAGKFHQPLVGLDLWAKVQNVLKQRNRSVYYLDKAFFPYRKLIRCSCGRGYCPYIKKGITYYYSKCKPDCVNSVKNLREKADLEKAIGQMIAKIYFSDEELRDIEARAKTELGVIASDRDKNLDDLHIQRKKWLADMDYLTTNKLTLLRTETMDATAIKDEESRIKLHLEEIEAKIKAYADSAEDMLNYVISFSELMKNASLYYEYALDTEKQEIVMNVFSELTFAEGELVNYKAKEGFEALLNRGNTLVAPSGARGGS